MTNTQKRTNLHVLVESAIIIARATVLSLVKLWEMPLGGSITLLSMLPIMLIALRHGTKPGLAAAFVYSLTQLFLGLPSLMSWGMTAAQWVGSLLFDYLIAFTVLGFAGVCKKHGFPGVIAGVALACALRFVSHFISGSIFFAVWCPDGWNVIWYSICYNGVYMLPNMLIAMVIAALLYVPMKKFFAGKDILGR